jgi:Helix-turn-helix domain
MKGPLTSHEKQRIRALLEENFSHNRIAAMVGRSQSTVSTFAKREGYSPLPERTPSVANQARREYSKAERLELIGLVFQRGEELLQKPGLSTREYKEVTTGIAIAIDKSRLEEGQPNSVHETRSGTPGVPAFNLQEEFERLDALQLQEESHTEYGAGESTPS